MARVCCFCGKEFRGQKRNREHIIPAWLVKEADLRKRTTEVSIGARTFRAIMQRIVGDSCESCNVSSSALEAKAKTTFLKIRDGLELEEADGQVLVDWLDKVRVGLWQWLLGASQGHYKVTPKFNMDARIRRKDRIGLIAKYPAESSMKGLALWGIGEQFLFMPSAMGLLINNIALVSLSTDFLLARHIRNIKLAWKSNDKLLETVNLEALGSDEGLERLRILGLPDIVGQCIGPEEAMVGDLKLDDLRQNPCHAVLLETPVMRLNAELRPVASPVVRRRS
jgi:hypothetical protein